MSLGDSRFISILQAVLVGPQAERGPVLNASWCWNDELVSKEEGRRDSVSFFVSSLDSRSLLAMLSYPYRIPQARWEETAFPSRARSIWVACIQSPL